MATLPLVLFIASLILLVLATFGVSGGRINLQPAGLACFVLAIMLSSGVL